MVELKTKPTRASVKSFVDSLEDDLRRRESRELMKIMRRVTGKRPKMWGDGIVGYGTYEYRYESGRSGTWFLTGFSPRKRALSIYCMAGFERFPALMKKLGKFKTGRSCLYVNKLDDVDRATLERLIERSVAATSSTGE